MELLLPNNSPEVNQKVNDLLIPLLEYLVHLEPDAGKSGFFVEENDQTVFKSATISISIAHKDYSKDPLTKALS